MSNNNINFDKNSCQLNVFLTQGNVNGKIHVRWHRDEDSDAKQISRYSMVVLLDEPSWSGGNFLCQYTGENVDIYKKKKFNTPIIKFTPIFRGGIILRNTDTRHMVDKIISSVVSTKTKRTVVVLQLYNKIYAYDT